MKSKVIKAFDGELVLDMSQAEYIEPPKTPHELSLEKRPALKTALEGCGIGQSVKLFLPYVRGGYWEGWISECRDFCVAICEAGEGVILSVDSVRETWGKVVYSALGAADLLETRYPDLSERGGLVSAKISEVENAPYTYPFLAIFDDAELLKLRDDWKNKLDKMFEELKTLGMKLGLAAAQLYKAKYSALQDEYFTALKKALPENLRKGDIEDTAADIIYKNRLRFSKINEMYTIFKRDWLRYPRDQSDIQKLRRDFKDWKGEKPKKRKKSKALKSQK